jgi:protein-tyrosine phosphatase
MPLGSISQIYQLALRGDITAKRSRHLMEEGYAFAADRLRGELGRFVNTVAAGDNATVVFHCTAGKDRTGMAAAVLLMALGVPEPVIVEDYLLTLRHGKLEHVVEYIVTMLKLHGARHIDEAAILPYCTVAESYIESFLAQVRRDYRSPRAYLERGLGVAPAALARLQRFYLEGEL